MNASPGLPTGTSWCFRTAPALPNRVAVSGESRRRAANQSGCSSAATTRRIQLFQAWGTGSREQRSQEINIWQIEIPTATQPGRSATELIASTRVDAGPQFSPDGTRIVFASDRSRERWDLGVRHRGFQPGSVDFVWRYPRWSPDGRRIAFDGDWGIHVIDVDAGPSRRVASDTPGGVVPSWSRDGNGSTSHSLARDVRRSGKCLPQADRRSR